MTQLKGSAMQVLKCSAFFFCVFWICARATATPLVVTNEHGYGVLQSPPRMIEASFGGANTVIAADIDGDGDLDVAASDQSRGAAWWENLDGTMTSWSNHVVDTTSDIRSLRAVDIDGDGDLDFCGAEWINDSFDWWENTLGDGTMWVHRVIAGDLVWASSISVADIDGDGDLDIAGCTEFYDYVGWWENPGPSGGIWAQRQIGTLSQAGAVSTGDLDGDGDVDIVAAGGWANAVVVYWNQDGVGGAWQTMKIDPSVSGPNSLSLTDMDNDGDLDILGTAAAPTGVLWWRNTGVVSNWPRIIIESNASGSSVVATNLDGDVYLDVAATLTTTSELKWWAGTSYNSTNWVARSLSRYMTSASAVTAADGDGDGNQELIAAGSGGMIGVWDDLLKTAQEFGTGITTQNIAAGTSVEAILGASTVGNSSSQWTFRTWTRTGVNPTNGTASRTDPFVVTNEASVTFNWQLQYKLTGAASGPGSIAVSNGWYDAGTNATGTAQAQPTGRFLGWSGDVPSGATNDLSISIPMDGPKTINAFFDWLYFRLTITNLYSATIIGTPALTFAAQPLPNPNGVFATYDVDGDGNTDMVGMDNAGGLSWWRNEDGRATTWSRYAVDPTVLSLNGLACGDADGDGDIDIFGCRSGDGVLLWFNAGFGSGAWARTNIAAVSDCITLAVSDADRDGHGDVVFGRNNGTIQWCRNPGATGTVWQVQTIGSVSGSAGFIKPADIDGDGDDDMLAASSYYSGYWFRNNGSTQWVAQNFGYGSLPYDAADMDMDGDLDILTGYVSSPYSSYVRWRENVGGNGNSWIDHSLPSMSGIIPSSLAAVDMDADGDADIVIFSSYNYYDVVPIVIAENIDGHGGAWSYRTIVPSGSAAFSQIADMDADGSLDIIGTYGNSYTPLTNMWWRNGSFLQTLFLPPSDSFILRASSAITVSSFMSAKEQGGTQQLCAGWTRLGSEPQSGTGRTSRFSFTNDASLSFEWKTRYRLDVASSPGGSAIPQSSWVDAGSNIFLNATASNYYHFAQWDGCDALTDPSNSVQILTMDAAYSVTALFGEDVSPPGVPHAWLAEFGITNDFDTAAWDDRDADEVPTWQEYIADTSPIDGTSYLRIVALSGNGTGAVVRWSGGSQACQVLESGGPDISGNLWTPIFTNNPPTALTNEWTDGSGTVERGFLRLRAFR